jgi:hypothetical protein
VKLKLNLFAIFLPDVAIRLPLTLVFVTRGGEEDGVSSGALTAVGIVEAKSLLLFLTVNGLVGLNIPPFVAEGAFDLERVILRRFLSTGSREFLPGEGLELASFSFSGVVGAVLVVPAPKEESRSRSVVNFDEPSGVQTRADVSADAVKLVSDSSAIMTKERG